MHYLCPQINKKQNLALDTMNENKPKVAIVNPADDHTKEVMQRAMDENVAEFVSFYGDDASVRAVGCVRSGNADVLMKGAVNTDVLLRAALDKERGILQKGRVMAHIAVASVPGWERPLIFSDAAVIPQPDIDQMDAIVRYTVEAARNLGIAIPKLALTNFTEKENPKFPQTAVYQEIRLRAGEGLYGDVVIGGPMDVKTALDSESGSIKGINSPVVGNADILIFPNIEAGNTFYKTLTLFAHANIAGWLAGTQVPVVVTSRADSVESKYYSLITAIKMTKR